MPSILAAALDAHDAGLSVVRASNDGTKKPVGQWKQHQTRRADRATIEGWFSGTEWGLGVVCGAVSGDLEMLELEGRFMTEIGSERFRQAMKEADLELLMQRLVNGFMVTSPSGGRHFYYRISNGEAAGNTKLARRPATTTELATNPTDPIRVLIETRGEGGFVVAPPSGGKVHPSGRPWATKAGSFAAIPEITAAERDAFHEVCRSFDTADTAKGVAVPPIPADRRIHLPKPNQVAGDSWFDAVVQHLRSTQPMVQLLEHYGWKFDHDDTHGRHLMSGPHHPDGGVSGSVNNNDRLCPFSTSTPFATGGEPPTTYDQLDVIAAYEHSGDRKAAGRAIAERTGILTAWKTAKDTQATTGRPPEGVDPATGEIRADAGLLTAVGGPLDDTFWEARPHLAHIRQAAYSRMVAPAAVLACILARIAAFTPPSTRLPAIIGATSPLSTYVALHARSGGGKSAATGCAADLLPDTPPACAGPLPVGSGEGLIDAYFELVEDEDRTGKKVRTKRQTRGGVLFTLDEGQALAEMGNRKGSTILPILRTAWSGSDAGQANASVETRRILRGGSYTLGLVSLWQDGAAARLIDDVDGGTPQRFVWVETTDATISATEIPEWPGPLQWKPPASIMLGGITSPHLMDVDADVVAEIRHAHAAAQRGEVEVHPLDAHRRLVKLKLAGLLAVLDGRHNIDTDDWWLAERLMAHSDRVRTWIISEADRGRRSVEAAATAKVAAREAVLETAQVQRALLGAAKTIQRAATRSAPVPLTKRQIHAAIASRHRQLVTTDEALTEATRLRWVTQSGEGEWVVGDAAPT